MFDPDRPGRPAYTTARMVRASEAAGTRLLPLVEIVAPLAKSRPDTPVSPDLLALARQALGPLGPVAMLLEAPAPLPLHPPVTNAGLAARLAGAIAQVNAFRRRYLDHGASGDLIWRVPEWMTDADHDALAPDDEDDDDGYGFGAR